MAARWRGEIVAALSGALFVIPSKAGDLGLRGPVKPRFLVAFRSSERQRVWLILIVSAAFRSLKPPPRNQA